jgi:hypothetical protein
MHLYAVCLRVCVCLCACVRARVRVCVHACVRVCMRACVRVRMCAHTCVNIYILATIGWFSTSYIVTAHGNPDVTVDVCGEISPVSLFTYITRSCCNSTTASMSYKMIIHKQWIAMDAIRLSMEPRYILDKLINHQILKLTSQNIWVEMATNIKHNTILMCMDDY